MAPEICQVVIAEEHHHAASGSGRLRLQGLHEAHDAAAFGAAVDQIPDEHEELLPVRRVPADFAAFADAEPCREEERFEFEQAPVHIAHRPEVVVSGAQLSGCDWTHAGEEGTWSGEATSAERSAATITGTGRWRIPPAKAEARR